MAWPGCPLSRASEPFRQEGHLSPSAVSRKAPSRGPLLQGGARLSASFSPSKAPGVGGTAAEESLWVALRESAGTASFPVSLAWGVEPDPSTGLNFPLGPEDPEISRTGSQGLGEGSGPLSRLPSHPERAPLVSFTFAIRCKILVDQRKPFFYLSSPGTISGADGPRSGSGCPASALGLLTSG